MAVDHELPPDHPERRDGGVPVDRRGAAGSVMLECLCLVSAAAFLSSVKVLR